MSLGILESLEARVKALEEKVFIQTDSAAPVLTLMDNLDPVETASDDVELDADGLPWNEEFHAATKSQNNDGTWKRIRISGENKEQRKAENDAAFEAWKNEYLGGAGDTIDEPAPFKPTPLSAAVESMAVPSTPKPPATPAAPSTPKPPATPAAPSKPVEPTEQRKALEAINVLTNEYKTDFDLIIDGVLKPLGADTFEALSAENYAKVTTECTAWAGMLSQVQDQIDRLDLVDTATNGDNNLMETVVGYHLNAHTKGAVILGQIGRANIGTLIDNLKESADQWVKWYASIPGGRDIDAELAKG
jgi:hypothetical protein